MTLIMMIMTLIVMKNTNGDNNDDKEEEELVDLNPCLHHVSCVSKAARRTRSSSSRPSSWDLGGGGLMWLLYLIPYHQCMVYLPTVG